MTTTSNTHTYDVFIAGGGIIACTFARILVEAGLRVVMVDAGAHESRRVGQNHKNIWKHQRNLLHYGRFLKGTMYPASVPPSGPPSTRNMLNPDQDPATNLPGAGVVYVVGGMATHWTCAIPQQHPTIERLEFISPEEWDRLYADAETLLNKHTDVFSTSIRHKVLKKFLQNRGFTVEDTPLAAERRVNNLEFVQFAGADTVLGDELAEPGANPKFTVLAEHRVTKLVCGGDSGKVRYAEVRDLNDPREDKKIAAEVFVVAAGWLHTAQILSNSGIHAGEDSALGCYLTEHTFTGCTVLLKRELMDEIGTLAKSSHRHEPSALDPSPVPMKDPPPHMYIPVSDDRLWHSMIFRESFHFDPLPENVDDRRLVDLKWFGMVDPNRSNRVTFSSRNRDMLGMPQPTFHFRLSDDDKRREHEMMLDMQNVAFELGDYLPGYGPQYVPLGTSTHTMGATRMGPDDDRGENFCSRLSFKGVGVGQPIPRRKQPSSYP
jgi:pyranose oxidase